VTGPTGNPGPTGATGSAGTGGLAAGGRVNQVQSGGFAYQIGFSPIVGGINGIYNLTLLSPITNMVINVTLLGNPGFTALAIQSSTTTIQVNTYDHTVTPADAAFYISVFSV
jgi:hypothetical protein